MDGLQPGFQDPAIESQQVFRKVLNALSRPGTVQLMEDHPTPVPPMNAAANATLLALADTETPIWLDPQAAGNGALVQHLKFHTGAPMDIGTKNAAFALITEPETMPKIQAFHPGTDEHPERATTLILQVGGIELGKGWELTGPGVKQPVRIYAHGMPCSVWEQLIEQRQLFPCGVDIILTAGNALMGLSRTTQIVKTF